MSRGSYKIITIALALLIMLSTTVSQLISSSNTKKVIKITFQVVDVDLDSLIKTEPTFDRGSIATLIRFNPQIFSNVSTVYVLDWPNLQNDNSLPKSPQKALIKNSVPINFGDVSNLVFIKKIPNSTILSKNSGPTINKPQLISQNLDNNEFLNGPPSANSTIDVLQRYLFYLTNKLRVNNSACLVELSPLLNKIALQNSEDMVRRNFFSHINPDGESVGDRAKRNGYLGSIGENLGIGQSVSQIQIGFINSPRHLQNAINPRWQDFGVGIVRNDSSIVVTVLFSPRNLTKNTLSDSQIIGLQKNVIIKLLSLNTSLTAQNKRISNLISEWRKTDRSTLIFDYISDRGQIYKPMRSYISTFDYSNDILQKVIGQQILPADGKIYKSVGVYIGQNKDRVEMIIVYI